MNDDILDEAIKKLEDIPEAKATRDALKKVKGSNASKAAAVDLIGNNQINQYSTKGSRQIDPYLGHPEMNVLRANLQSIINGELSKLKGDKRAKLEATKESLLLSLMETAEESKKANLAEYRTGEPAGDRKQILKTAKSTKKALEAASHALSADCLDKHTKKLLTIFMLPEFQRDNPTMTPAEIASGEMGENWIANLKASLDYLSERADALSSELEKSLKEKNRLPAQGLGHIASVIANDFDSHGITPASTDDGFYCLVVKAVFAFLGVPEQKSIERHLSDGIKLSKKLQAK